MRAFNRLISLLLGLVLLLGGILVAINGVLALLDARPWPVRVDKWYDELTSTHLRDTTVIGSSVGLAVLGLVLLFAQVRPWAPVELSVLPSGDGQDEWWVQRRSAERRLVAAANEVTGVDRAKVRLRGRGGRWRLLLSAQGRAEAYGEVERAVRAELNRLAAPQRLKLRVSLRKPKRVA